MTYQVKEITLSGHKKSNATDFILIVWIDMSFIGRHSQTDYKRFETAVQKVDSNKNEKWPLARLHAAYLRNSRKIIEEETT